MIVREDGDALLLVTQPDHAALAGRLAERFVGLDGHPRRSSVLRAAREHDGGWAELDAAPYVDDAGNVADYVRIALPLRQGVWPRGIARLAAPPLADPWAAALVAHHALVAYARFDGDPEWTGFFAEMRALRERHLAASGLGQGELEADYPFLRLADLVSLAFCNARYEARFAQWSVQGDGATVSVAPDLFGGATVELAVEARAIPRRSYAGDADLRATLRAAPARTLHGRAHGG